MKEKIQRTFVSREVHTKLRNWILEGTLSPGAKLRDKELAEQLGISRTPVREALLRLEDEGLVQTKPNRSTLVSSIDFDNALHLYSIVWTLEQLALSQAFSKVTEAHIDQMTNANERFLQKMQTRDRMGALEADHEFHSIYVSLSQNLELEKIITEVKYKLKRIDLYYFDKVKNSALSYEEHKQIIQALRKRDLSLAMNAVEDNWKNSFSRFNI